MKRGITGGVSVLILALLITGLVIVGLMIRTYYSSRLGLLLLSKNLIQPQIHIVEARFLDRNTLQVTVYNSGPVPAHVYNVYVYVYGYGGGITGIDSLGVSFDLPVGGRKTFLITREDLSSIIGPDRPLRLLFDTDHGMVIASSTPASSTITVNLHVPSTIELLPGENWETAFNVTLDCGPWGKETLTEANYTATSSSSIDLTYIFNILADGVCQLIVTPRNPQGLVFPAVIGPWSSIQASSGNQLSFNSTLAGIWKVVLPYTLSSSIYVKPGKGGVVDLSLPSIWKGEGEINMGNTTGPFILDFSNWYVVAPPTTPATETTYNGPIQETKEVPSNTYSFPILPNDIDKLLSIISSIISYRPFSSSSQQTTAMLGIDYQTAQEIGGELGVVCNFITQGPCIYVTSVHEPTANIPAGYLRHHLITSGVPIEFILSGFYNDGEVIGQITIDPHITSGRYDAVIILGAYANYSTDASIEFDVTPYIIVNGKPMNGTGTSFAQYDHPMVNHSQLVIISPYNGGGKLYINISIGINQSIAHVDGKIILTISKIIFFPANASVNVIAPDRHPSIPFIIIKNIQNHVIEYPKYFITIFPHTDNMDSPPTTNLWNVCPSTYDPLLDETYDDCSQLSDPHYLYVFEGSMTPGDIDGYNNEYDKNPTITFNGLAWILNVTEEDEWGTPQPQTLIVNPFVSGGNISGGDITITITKSVITYSTYNALLVWSDTKGTPLKDYTDIGLLEETALKPIQYYGLEAFVYGQPYNTGGSSNCEEIEWTIGLDTDNLPSYLVLTLFGAFNDTESQIIVSVDGGTIIGSDDIHAILTTNPATFNNGSHDVVVEISSNNANVYVVIKGCGEPGRPVEGIGGIDTIGWVYYPGGLPQDTLVIHPDGTVDQQGAWSVGLLLEHVYADPTYNANPYVEIIDSYGNVVAKWIIPRSLVNSTKNIVLALTGFGFNNATTLFKGKWADGYNIANLYAFTTPDWYSVKIVGLLTNETST